MFLHHILFQCRGWKMVAAFVDEKREKQLLSQKSANAENAFDANLKLMQNGKGGYQVFESIHPYDDNSDIITEVNCPGLGATSIAFSSESSTESNYDYVTFCKSAEGSEYYGLEKYSGGRGDSSKCFPGIGEKKPLVIPATQFWVKFHSDGSINDWFVVEFIISCM